MNRVSRRSIDLRRSEMHTRRRLPGGCHAQRRSAGPKGKRRDTMLLSTKFYQKSKSSGSFWRRQSEEHPSDGNAAGEAASVCVLSLVNETCQLITLSVRCHKLYDPAYTGFKTSMTKFSDKLLARSTWGRGLQGSRRPTSFP